MAYLTHSDADRREMLKTVGAAGVDELFTSIPAQLRHPQLELPKPLSEQELVADVAALAGRNHPVTQYDNFLGAGAYSRYIPAIVRATISRPEFYTAYTPYQAEASQGTLQTIFEFQSMVAELYALDVANASLYDGPTAASEAVLLAAGQTNRSRVVIAGDVHPEVREVVATFAGAHELELEVTAPDDIAVNEQTAAVLLAQPGVFGNVADHRATVDAAHAAGALAICYADPFASALLTPPGETGFDIAVGDGQQFGIPLSFGGPHLGLIAVSAALMRRIPGRLVGETTDSQGRRAYTLTLQAREQHIRREKATSNICTNHALMALAATAYLGYMGAAGVRHLAEVSTLRAHSLAARLQAEAGWQMADARPFLWEFAIDTGTDAQIVAAQLRQQGIVAGLPLGRFDKKRNHQLLVACTEMTTSAAIDHYVASAQKATALKVSA
jgi:glycine cleavage system P protein (glycine dehydrogenase) subunit 1